jgi:DNA-directed RNA polymerase subunit RPC12/RpoP
MTDHWREFVCVDCKTHVYTLLRDEKERCLNCDFVRRLELPPEREREIRAVLGCELPPEEAKGEPHE